MRTLLIATAILCAAVAMAAPVTIVEDGQAKAVIVLTSESVGLVSAATEMQESIAEASGATLDIVAAPVDGMASIHIGQTDMEQAVPVMDDLDDDGFYIDFPEADEVLIIGPTDYGTEYGVYEFLERYVGVRWVLPGEDGRDVPAQATIAIPDTVVRDEPKFFSRLMSGWRGEAQSTWTRRMRMHGRIGFHHNLIQLFPPETYTATHPEFFPLRGDERFLPETNSTHHWQPCFTADGIVDEAIKNIIAYFDENPDVPSYSLGVNDSSGHCECENCKALDPGRKNVIGRDHLSDRYFTWCNAVVEGVLEVYPDKWFGCLAYSEIFEPPDTVKVNERIIPYMTYDRMKWADAELRAEGEEITRQWAKMSPTLGWYDYIYGTPFCLPRVWMHHMADYYRFGYENGVRAMYAEAYPNFGEGPKLYVALKLQWDPYQDVDALLDEWYERCAGPEGGPYVKKYYEFWEDFWTTRILDSAWFSKGGQYLSFGTAGYLADVTIEEIAQCREWLQAGIDNAQTDKQRARVEMLMLAFEYYEASALSYPRSELAEGPLDTEELALAAIDGASVRIDMAAKRRYIGIDVLDKHPVLLHALPLTRYGGLSGDSWGATSLWRVYDWLDRSDTLRARIEDLAANSESLLVRDQANIMLAMKTGSMENMATNGSFEEGPEGWSLWVKPNLGGRMLRSDEQAHSGEWSLLCDGVGRGGPNQIMPITPGRYAAVCFVYTPEDQEMSGTVELAITPRDEKGGNIPGMSTMITPVPGRWTAVATGGNITAQMSGKDVASVIFLPIVNGFEEGDKVYIDDVSLFRLGDIGE